MEKQNLDQNTIVNIKTKRAGRWVISYLFREQQQQTPPHPQNKELEYILQKLEL